MTPISGSERSDATRQMAAESTVSHWKCDSSAPRGLDASNLTENRSVLAMLSHGSDACVSFTNENKLSIIQIDRTWLFGLRPRFRGR